METETTATPAPTLPAPTPVTTPTFVTIEQLEGLVRAINEKFAAVDNTQLNTTFRLETFLRLMCQHDTITHSSFVEGLGQFHAISKKIDELRKITKLSERIAKAIEYNNSVNPKNGLTILADDINILKDVENAESISRENFDSLQKLESTATFTRLISKFEPK